MIDKGQAERVLDEERHLSNGRIWYIPHHSVYHLQKWDKIHVFFDASFIGVLCCFRKEPISFTCDVEGLFHQVYVNPDHRKLLRFLWWSDGDVDSKPTEFRMTVYLGEQTSL